MSGWLYILAEDGKTPIPEPDVLVWGKWFETHKRQIAGGSTEVGSMHVSTVFLGIDYSFHGLRGVPILWETKIFGGVGECEGYERRYSSYDDAVSGHDFTVDWARSVWMHAVPKESGGVE